MNPFSQKPGNVKDGIQNWGGLYPQPYDKNNVDPYTKTRIILMNGAEFEANWFSHQFSRHCNNNDLRRELAEMRRVEKHQQMKIANLKPLDETILETTIGYEQVAVDLTAMLAQMEPDVGVRKALNFALLEDFDHLYRYANLLEMEQGILAAQLVGGYTEIMPARPTISEHRCPMDDIRYPIENSKAALITKLNVGIITAAEQQTMNYYMNATGFYTSDLGRQLFQEIGLIEEQHVSHYGSLIDPNATWLESLLMHEYTECYLYYSCYKDETDPRIKQMWEEFFAQEVAHLHKAAQLLQQYEKKEWQQVIPDGTFPQLLHFEPNIGYVRNILQTVNNTTCQEEYVPVSTLAQDASFFAYQKKVNNDVAQVPSHKVICQHIAQKGSDYRDEVAPNPIEALRDRTCDNTEVGRTRQLAVNCAPLA